MSAFLLLGKADFLRRAERVQLQGPPGAGGDTLPPLGFGSSFMLFFFVNHFNTVTVTEMQYKGEIIIKKKNHVESPGVEMNAINVASVLYSSRKLLS